MHHRLLLSFVLFFTCVDRDLHAETKVPLLKMSSVERFLISREKKLDTKATNMYKDNYVNYIRVCSTDYGTHFKAEIRAEMRANVVYVVDLLLSPEAIVLESQCECAAGMGPSAHCKHVCCVLFGLTEFAESKEFKTLETCTQQLQTFHKAKKHLGSPVKAEQLKLHVSENLNFDPRPASFRENRAYQGFFQNSLLNSRAFGDAPIMQIVPPANPYAFNNDHDYMKVSPAEHFLASSGLKTVTEQERKSIEKNTRDNVKLWRSERKKRLCSSQFGTICKLTERADKKKTAKRFVLNRQFSSAACNHGRMYEEVAVQRYEHETGSQTQKCGLFIAEESPFLASTPDRVVNDRVVLEVKCPYTARHMMVTPKTVPYLTSENGSLGLRKTHDYYYQVQGQMYCVGEKVQLAHFCVFTFEDFQIIPVSRDEEFIAVMLEKLQAFHDEFHKMAVLEEFFFRNYSSHF